MKFAAGLTVTGILGFLLMEALKIIMVPVTAWVMTLLVFALKALLVVLALGVVGVVIAVGVFIYKRGQRTAAEA
jgi:hypothetical protein